MRGELLDLSVSEFVIKTVREQMRYDATRLVVVAGKPFEIIFETPALAPLDAQRAATVLGLHGLVAAYRRFISYAAGL